MQEHTPHEPRALTSKVALTPLASHPLYLITTAQRFDRFSRPSKCNMAYATFADLPPEMVGNVFAFVSGSDCLIYKKR